MPTNPETWQRRQAAIRDLLSRHAITNQADLLKKLAARGFRATQSSVSRDLSEMGVAKASGRYVLPEALAANGRAHGAAPRRLAEPVRDAKAAGPHLFIVATPPGSASAVALAIDAAAIAGVLGTVAGDDTVFAATANTAAQDRLAAWLRDPASIKGQRALKERNRS